MLFQSRPPHLELDLKLVGVVQPVKITQHARVEVGLLFPLRDRASRGLEPVRSSSCVPRVSMVPDGTLAGIEETGMARVRVGIM